MTVDPSWLRTWVQVVDSGGFARAANAIHLSQPRVSVHIAHLERELGVRLIVRRVRPLTLTPEGARLLPRARAVLDAMDELESDAASTSGDPAEQLRIASFVSASSTFLPAIVAAFQEAHPRIDIGILDGDVDQIGTALTDGRVTIALRPLWPEVDDRTAVVEPLWTEDFVAVIPAGHPLEGFPALPVAALAGVRLITLGDPFSPAAVGREAARLLSSIRPPSVAAPAGLVAHQPTTLAAMVRQGLGIGLVNRLASSMISSDDLVVRPVENLTVTREVGVWWRTDRPLTPAAAEFVDAVRKSPAPPGTTAL